MITRGRKRTEKERDLSQKRLREEAKRAKDIGKKARGAESREPDHQGDAIGDATVTQTKMGKNDDGQMKTQPQLALDSCESSDNCGSKRRRVLRSTADKIEVSTKRAKNGQNEWEEKNEEIT
jgi:hypothetical protein